jgi:two-component system LytT family response regulator
VRVIRTLIVDDEELARQSIRIRLQGEADVEIVGEAGDGLSAMRAIQKLAPDLIFLDVRMPRFGGFEILERTRPGQRPLVIFVTAYDQYAAKAFEAHAVDYLLKPINQSRFQEALRRVRSEVTKLEPVKEEVLEEQSHVLEAVQKGPTAPHKPGEHVSHSLPLRRLVVKTGDGFLLLKMEDVDWVESAANYVRLHVRDNSFLLRTGMDELEEKLDGQQFARIHRSRIVNIDRITEIRPTLNGDFEVLLRDNTTLRLSRGYRSRLLPQLTR